MNPQKSFQVRIDVERLSQDKAQKLHLQLCNDVLAFVGTANQCAYAAIADAYDALDGARLIHHAIKRHAPKCVLSCDSYYRNQRSFLGKRTSLWSDMACIAAHHLQPEIERLYSAINQRIETHLQEMGYRDNIPTFIRAHIYTAQALTDIAVSLFDGTVRKYQSQIDLNITSEIAFMRLADVKHHWGEVVKAVSHVPGRVDLNDDPDIQKAVEDLTLRYQEPGFVNDAAGEAIRLNPSAKKYLSPEEIIRFYGTTQDTTPTQYAAQNQV